MTKQVLFNTITDTDRIYSVISSVVMLHTWIAFHDKHDCTMDLWYDLLYKDGVLRKEAEYNASYIKKRVNDRIKNWKNKNYRRVEFSTNITDSHFPLPEDPTPNFLWADEQDEIYDNISTDIKCEFNELFNSTVKELAKKHGTSESAIKKRRARFMARARLEVAELNPELWRDIKRSQR